MIKGIAIVNLLLTRAVAIVLVTAGEYDEGQECDKSSNDKFVKSAV